MDELDAKGAHETSHNKVDQSHTDNTKERAGQAIELGRADDGRNKGEAAAQENGHLTSSDEVEQEGSYASREKGGRGVEPRHGEECA